MTNIKVSEMTEATSFDDDDYTMIVQANQNKKISRQNIFNNFENNISTINNKIGDLSSLKSQVKTDISSAINSVIDAEIYSTNEIKTNKIWIDGKSVYRKVITFDSSTFQNNTNLDTGITNLENVIKLECLAKSSSDSGWRNIPWTYSNSNFPTAWSGGFFLKTNGGIFFQLGNNLANFTCLYVIVEYTKTS